ncbi:MAG: hypothetical protein DCC75_13490, partial [Proteobacteria bacterium]
FLSFRKSSEDVLGKELVFEDKGDNLEELLCRNSDGSELLRLVRRESSPVNSVQQFYVRRSEARQEAVKCKLDEVAFFKSFRGIHLGMSIKEVTGILGDRYAVKVADDHLVLVYSIVGNQFSSFLNYYSELEYTGRYKFKTGKLIEYSFGFGAIRESL